MTCSSLTNQACLRAVSAKHSNWVLALCDVHCFFLAGTVTQSELLSVSSVPISVNSTSAFMENRSWTMDCTDCLAHLTQVMFHVTQWSCDYKVDWVFTRTGISSVKEPSCFSRCDGKRPWPWSHGKLFAAWFLLQLLQIQTVAIAYLPTMSLSTGSAAETAAARKEAKYAA